MIYQQYTSAVKEAYAGRPGLEQQVASASACREWLQSLRIDPKLLDGLVEQVKALEEGFRELSAKEK
jgi:hypothetical protein